MANMSKEDREYIEELMRTGADKAKVVSELARLSYTFEEIQEIYKELYKVDRKLFGSFEENS